MTAQPSTKPQRMTLDEYWAIADTKPYPEYLAGFVERKPVSNTDHVQLAGEIAAEFAIFRRQHGGTSGPEASVEFVVDLDVFVRLPDVAYWASARPVGPKQAMHPPSVAVEIRSPSQTVASQREKCEFMHENGVETCWLIDPETRTASILEARCLARHRRRR